MAGVCAVGGAVGYARTRSVPSIVAGLSVGAIYAYGGWRIQEGKDYGYEICAAASLILLGSSAPRMRKGPVPATLTATSTAALGYYGKKVCVLKLDRWELDSLTLFSRSMTSADSISVSKVSNISQFACIVTA